MSRPWMPLYAADYLADTAHLDAMQSGAYLHLIMHYWLTGALPEDPKQLAKIAKVTPHCWKKICPVIQNFFHDGWKHKRIEEELARASAISTKRSDAAKGRSKIQPAKAEQLQTQPPPPSLSHPQKEKNGGGDARAREAVSRETDQPMISDASNKLADELAAIAGIDPIDPLKGWYQASYRVQIWLNNGWPRELILLGAREAMATKRDGRRPYNVDYFEQPIARLIAQQSKPLPKVQIVEGETVHVRPVAENRSLSAVARQAAQLADEIARGSGVRDESGGGAIRVISGGKGP